MQKSTLQMDKLLLHHQYQRLCASLRASSPGRSCGGAKKEGVTRLNSCI